VLQYRVVGVACSGGDPPIPEGSLYGRRRLQTQAVIPVLGVYRGVTRVLQGCYKGVAGVLQGCCRVSTFSIYRKHRQQNLYHRSITRVLQGCYRGVTGVL
jgi:hypothetical protein